MNEKIKILGESSSLWSHVITPNIEWMNVIIYTIYIFIVVIFLQLWNSSQLFNETFFQYGSCCCCQQQNIFKFRMMMMMMFIFGREILIFHLKFDDLHLLLFFCYSHSFVVHGCVMVSQIDIFIQGFNDDDFCCCCCHFDDTQ